MAAQGRVGGGEGVARRVVGKFGVVDQVDYGLG